MYRSPNSPDRNNETLLDILRIAASAKFDYLMVCGDFNLPKINWNGNLCLDMDTSFTADFIEVMEQVNWFQHSRNHTRFRGTQSCLDLVFANEENKIDEITELPPIGKSDHACQRWELTVSDIVLKNTNVLRPNFKRADWKKIKRDVQSLTLDPSEPAGAMMDKFLAMIDKSKKDNIPVCRPRSIKNWLPWMRHAKNKQQRTRKW